MKIKEVTYGRTVSKNYQSRRAEVTVTLERGDTYAKALARAKKLVADALGETPTADQIAGARDVLALIDE